MKAIKGLQGAHRAELFGIKKRNRFELQTHGTTGTLEVL
jgi:hypothetical protein